MDKIEIDFATRSHLQGRIERIGRGAFAAILKSKLSSRPLPPPRKTAGAAVRSPRRV
jgi:hypothetical protein